MSRTKGAKNKNRGAISDEKAAELALARQKNISNSPTLTKMSTIDRNYLKSMLGAFVVAVEPTLIDGEIPNTNKKFKYTPKQMFANIVKFFEVSLDMGQPLTITGMAMFCGMSREYVLNLSLGKPTGNMEKVPEEYGFLIEARRFVENYNEYAAHKKQNPAGPIFILKNFGWKDKLEIEAHSNGAALSEEERKVAQERIHNFSETGTPPTAA